MMRQPQVNHSQFWLANDLDGLGVLKASYSTHRFPRHFHETYVIRIQETGVEEFEYRGAKYHAPAGSIVMIHPGEIRTGRRATHDIWSYRAIYPEIFMMDQLASAVGISAPFFASPVVNDPELYQTFLKMHRKLETSSESLERQSLFVATMSTLIERNAGSRDPFRRMRSESSAVALIREYLDAHHAENPTLDELANLVGLNRFYLLRTFRREIGMPPHEYLTQVRVESAKRLLARGWPLAEAALESGFVDQSHLSKRFKRFVGITPKQYARQLR